MVDCPFMNNVTLNCPSTKNTAIVKYIYAKCNVTTWNFTSRKKV